LKYAPLIFEVGGDIIDAIRSGNEEAVLLVCTYDRCLIRLRSRHVTRSV